MPNCQSEKSDPCEKVGREGLQLDSAPTSKLCLALIQAHFPWEIILNLICHSARGASMGSAFSVAYLLSFYTWSGTTTHLSSYWILNILLQLTWLSSWSHFCFYLKSRADQGQWWSTVGHMICANGRARTRNPNHNATWSLINHTPNHNPIDAKHNPDAALSDFLNFFDRNMVFKVDVKVHITTFTSWCLLKTRDYSKFLRPIFYRQEYVSSPHTGAFTLMVSSRVAWIACRTTLLVSFHHALTPSDAWWATHASSVLCASFCLVLKESTLWLHLLQSILCLT